MRIITGKAKGAKLKAPKGENTRPTADRIKESLFNILGYTVLEARVLDLFSGTGNLGLEAVSRGAESAIMVDKHKDSIAAMKYNAAHTRLEEQVEILQGDVFACIDKLAKGKKQFDLIFADPPYGKGYEIKLLEALNKVDILSSDSLVIIEHSKVDELPETVGDFNLVRRQTYGATTSISFYRHGVKQEEEVCE